MSNDIIAHLKNALEAHGLPVVENADFLSVDGGHLELQAQIFEKDAPAGSFTVVLEVLAYSKLLNSQPIVECFAGFGDSKDRAISDAFEKMLLGSFHVLIEALTTHACEEEQAKIEHWTRDNVVWKVFSGPLLTQNPGTSTLSSTYPDFFSKLNSLFVETVTPGPHWVRVFLGSYHGQVQVAEVLLDNESWGQAQTLLLAQNWTCTNDYQSVRHFVLALPSPDRGG